MDTPTGPPFRPFGIMTRERIKSTNNCKNMDYLTTFLTYQRLQKYDQWFSDALDNSDQRTKIYSGKPTEGGTNKLRRIISEMEQRKYTLPKYVSELNVSGSVWVDKLHKILTYLLRISNYPMDPKTVITRSICEILQKVLDVMKKDELTRVPYFFTICAVILDIMCASNYTPFIQEWDKLMALVEQLKDVAKKTDKLEHIGAEGTEEEKKEKKQELFKSVKYFYLPEKGPAQTKNAKVSKNKAREILKNFLLKQKAADSVPEVEKRVEAAFLIEYIPNEEFCAVQGLQLDGAGPSSANAAALPTFDEFINDQGEPPKGKKARKNETQQPNMNNKL